MSKLKFVELADPATEPEKIISKGQLSILYLKGYETLPASAIVSILLENLFKHRQEVNEEIPPFLTVIEEAHNFIPSRSILRLIIASNINVSLGHGEKPSVKFIV